MLAQPSFLDGLLIRGFRVALDRRTLDEATGHGAFVHGSRAARTLALWHSASPPFAELPERE